MPSVINSDNGVISGTSGLKTSGSNDGLLDFQSNGTRIAGITTSAFQVGTDNISAVNSMGFRNRIINGAMMIDQRNAGASVTVGPSLSSILYTLDRWFGFATSTRTFTVQRSTTIPAGFVNSAQLTVGVSGSPSASEQLLFGQSVEGFNAADFDWGTANAQTITISFWVRSSITGTYGFGVQNSGGSRSYIATYTINAANTWEYKTITVPGDTSGTWLTNNGIGLNIRFDLGSGSNYNGTANTWSGSFVWRTSGSVNWIANAGATWFVTGVQLEAGSVATPFERRDYGRELMMCQRYFCKTYNIADATGTNTSNGWMGQQNGTNGQSYLTWFFPVRMRAAPTITYQANGTGSLWYDSAGGYIMTPSTVRIGEGQVLILVTGGNSNTECAGHAFASIEL